MAAKAAALRAGSIRRSFDQKRERLLSSTRGFSYAESIEEDPPPRRCCRSCLDGIGNWWRRLPDVGRRAWKMGRSDPRKIVFSLKMGLALSLISLLIFLKEPFKDLSRYSIWSILTVVVVFEFSIGATLSKGLNRGLGTLLAGGFAMGMALLSKLTGEWDEVFLVVSIFTIGSFATYLKLYPTMKPYEYGFRVFLLTYCFVMVSGYRTKEFIYTAATRFMHIALGAAVGLLVNICIYPIWAGEDLHKLVVKNFMGVANSLEGCVNGYFSSVEYQRAPSLILTYQASDDPLYSGYRAAVESINQEDTLMGFAIWEPPHGPYKSLRYPWKSYVKVSGAMRHCAFTVMALHGCILAEIQPPTHKKRVFQKEVQRVGMEGAKVLRELGTKMKKMEKLGSEDILDRVHKAAEELQKKIDQKSYLFVNAECWEIGERSKVGNVQDLINLDESEHNVLEYKSLSEAVLDLRSTALLENLSAPNTKNTVTKSTIRDNGTSEKMFKKQVSLAPRSSEHDEAVLNVEESSTFESASALSLSTFTSLLIEFVARLQNLVDSYEELSEKAKFKEPHGLLSAEAEPSGFWMKLSKRLTG